MQKGDTVTCGHCDSRFAEGLKIAERAGIECDCICHNQPKEEWEREVKSHFGKLDTLFQIRDGEVRPLSVIVKNIVYIAIHQTEQRVANDVLKKCDLFVSLVDMKMYLKHHYNINE